MKTEGDQRTNTSVAQKANHENKKRFNPEIHQQSKAGQRKREKRERAKGPLIKRKK